MIYDLHNGFFLATGTLSRDAKFQYVGDKQTPKTSFSLIAGKRKDTTTIFLDCDCWRSLALATAHGAKGDCAAVIGRIEERDWNGKIYKNLVCEWANIAAEASEAVLSAPLPDVAKAASSYTDFDDADGDLPF